MILNEFDGLFDDHSVKPICFNPLSYHTQPGLQVSALIPNHGAANESLLPFILIIQFGDGYIELTSQA